MMDELSLRLSSESCNSQAHSCARDQHCCSLNFPLPAPAVPLALHKCCLGSSSNFVAVGKSKPQHQGTYLYAAGNGFLQH